MASTVATTKIPISIFDENDELVAIVANYETAYFERDWRSAGQFEVTTNINLAGSVEFVRNRTVLFGTDKKKFGIITQTKKSIDENGKGGEKLTVTGYEMKKVLDWRMVAPGTGDDYFAYTAAAETVMHNLVKYQADPATVGTIRGFAKLVRETDGGAGSTYVLNARWTTSVLAEIEACSAATGRGSWIEYNIIAGNAFNWLFRTSAGVNRTSGQSINDRVIFNTDFGTLKSADATDSDASYKSIAFVAGQGEGAARNIRTVYLTATEPASIARRELFIDARDLELNASLDARAASTLTDNSYTLFLEGSTLPISQIQFGVDYDLGDICTVSQFGLAVDARIIRTKESWVANSYNIDLTFDKNYADISSLVKKNATAAATALVSVDKLGSGVIDEGTWDDATGSGHWELSKNGTLRIWGASPVSATSFTQVGSVFVALKTVTFPKSFLDTSFVYHDRARTGAQAGAWTGQGSGRSVNSVETYLLQIGSGALTIGVDYEVVGKIAV